MDEFSKIADAKTRTISYDDILKLLQKEFPDKTQTAIKQAIGDYGYDRKFSQSDVKRCVSILVASIESKPKQAELKVLKSDTGWSHHSLDVEEIRQMSRFINENLLNDKDLKSILPINENSMDIFEKCKNGIILCKLVNIAAPDTIDPRVINISSNLSVFEIAENNNLAINSAKSIGVRVVNVGNNDIIAGTQHIVLGLVWQIVKIHLLSIFDVDQHPELKNLLNAGENQKIIFGTDPEDMMIRWVNYHLKKGGKTTEISNLSSDMKDLNNLIILLHQLYPNDFSLSLLNETLENKAEKIISTLERMKMLKYISKDALINNKSKLILAFLAYLFSIKSGLEDLEEAPGIDESLFSKADSREARQFCNWINSLGIDSVVTNLFQDLNDGTVLTQVIEKVLNPKEKLASKTHLPPNIYWLEKVSNNNLVLQTLKQHQFVIVNIDGKNLYNGDKIAVFAILWQLMRAHIIEILTSLTESKTKINDQDIIIWANQTLREAGSSESLKSFKDASLKSCILFLDLLQAIGARVSKSTILKGETEQECQSNAMYAISLTRREGIPIFLSPDDILEGKYKLISVYIATLMAAKKEREMLNKK